MKLTYNLVYFYVFTSLTNLYIYFRIMPYKAESQMTLNSRNSAVEKAMQMEIKKVRYTSWPNLGDSNLFNSTLIL